MCIRDRGAVVSGTLEFSGGYTPFIDFGGATAFALDDVFSPADADAVSVRGDFNNSSFVFQANTTDLSTLTSDELVGPGVSFDSSPDPSDLEYFVFTYADEFGDIVYFGDTANNASFAATASSRNLAAWRYSCCRPFLLLAADVE